MYGEWLRDGKSHLRFERNSSGKVINAYSYETCILAQAGSKLIVNVTKYSSTTAKHRSKAISEAVKTGWNWPADFVEVGNLLEGVKDYNLQEALKWKKLQPSPKPVKVRARSAKWSHV